MSSSSVPFINWSDVDLSGLTLITGWRVGRRIETRRIATTKGVADNLAGSCRSTLEILSTLQQREWTPEAPAEKEEYLFAGNDKLDVASNLLISLRAKSFDKLSAQEIIERDFLFYALIVGPQKKRVVFLRKLNPRKALSNRLVTFYKDRLSKIEKPLFIFDYQTDLVYNPIVGIAILKLGVFNLLFKNTPEMLERIPDQVEEIAGALPMTSDSISFISSRAANDTRIRRRLESIVARDHLRAVTIDVLRDEIQRQGLDPDQYIKNGELDIHKGDETELLKILNEDLFVGGLSGTAFEVARKTTRPV